jgi:hypothetical protein
MSLDTIVRIENALGSSILKVGNRLASGDLTLTECITILTLSVRAGGNDVKDNDIKILVSDIGLMESIRMTGELIALALNPSESEPSTEKKVRHRRRTTY